MTLNELLEGRIDFKGQKRADDVVRVVLITSTFLSFVVGFTLSSLWITFSTFVLCTVALSLVVLPPWPMFNQHPAKWLPAQEHSAKSKSK